MTNRSMFREVGYRCPVKGCNKKREDIEFPEWFYFDLFNRLHQKLETIPERDIDEQGYTLVRYAEVAEMLHKVFQELEAGK